MKNMHLVSAAVLTSTVFFAPAASAVPRTFVSGATGLDSNTSFNCTKNKPCRNFSAAYTVTDAGGEIVALDSANYGTLVINKALTVFAPASVEGAVQVPNGGTGLLVNAGASDVVVIRGLVITTIPTNTGTFGIDHVAGKLVVEGVTFQGLDLGLDTTAKVDVIYSRFWGNAVGLQASGAGCNPIGLVCTVAALLRGSDFVSNGTALVSNDPGTNGDPTFNPQQNILIFSDSNNFANNAVYLGGNGTVVTYGSGANPH